ncbi:hypothetical protein CL656_05460 [bacterium]|nr:hypothetical protein [bacterium]|tara:strand:- start:6459 stop:7862 length:1404 start_codon:yes stop_codon:yes gene_type:complete
MQKKIKFLIISQSFLVIAVLTFYFTLNLKHTNTIQTNSVGLEKNLEINSLYKDKSNNQNSQSILLSIHNYIKNNQSSKALLLIDSLYKENPNSSLSYLVASHIFLLKDQNQLAYENLQKASKFSDFKKYNTHLDIQLNLILNNLNYIEQNLSRININDPNQTIHYLVYLAKNQNFKELENIFENDFILTNELNYNLKQDYEYFKTFKDGNRNMLYNLWAKSLIKNQYIHYARSLLLDAIQNDSSSHNSYLLLSYCYILSENYEEALQILNKSKKIDPYNQNINFYLALLNYQENNYKESLVFLDKVKDKELYNQKIKLLGLNKYNLKEFTSAEKYLKEYQNNNPEDLLSIEYLLNIYFNEKKDLQNAYSLIKKLEKLNFNTANYYNLLGLSYLNLNNSNKADEYFKKALNLDSNYYPALFNQAKLLIKTDDITQSSLNLQRGLKIAEIHKDKKFIKKFKVELNRFNN